MKNVFATISANKLQYDKTGSNLLFSQMEEWSSVILQK